MGLRSGLIIGGVLFITITGTFIFMDMASNTLERFSLGAVRYVNQECHRFNRPDYADLAGGKARFQVIVDSGVIRLISVAKAAGTTILGMMPLLTHAFLLSWPSPICSDLVSLRS